MKYQYAWKNNDKRESLYGKECKIIYRMRMNSALVEFEDGEKVVISRNALRKVNATP
jgi:hypothetical protein